jgi:hypothetical protein
LRRSSLRFRGWFPFPNHKHWVFIVAGLLIAGNFVYVYVVAPKLRLRNEACDWKNPDACQTASRFSWIVLWRSAGLYIIGFFTGYILGSLRVRFG